MNTRPSRGAPPRGRAGYRVGPPRRLGALVRGQGVPRARGGPRVRIGRESSPRSSPSRPKPSPGGPLTHVANACPLETESGLVGLGAASRGARHRRDDRGLRRPACGVLAWLPAATSRNLPALCRDIRSGPATPAARAAVASRPDWHANTGAPASRNAGPRRNAPPTSITIGIKTSTRRSRAEEYLPRVRIMKVKIGDALEEYVEVSSPPRRRGPAAHQGDANLVTR